MHINEAFWPTACRQTRCGVRIEPMRVTKDTSQPKVINFIRDRSNKMLLAEVKNR